MADGLNMFGWELIYKLNEKLIKSKEDVVIIFTHWSLLRRGFLCAGIGEDTTNPKPQELTELLPDGWNNTPYRLRYSCDLDLCILSGMTIDQDTLLLNLMHTVDKQVSGTTVNLAEIKQLNGTLKEIMPNHNEMSAKVMKELVEPVMKMESTKAAETQTTSDHSIEQRSSGQISNPQTRESILPPRPGFPFERNVGVGASDLNPFMPAPGGGMLFQPPGMGPRPGYIDPELPRGAVPPGARYDPFQPFGGPRPPVPGRGRAHPDYDHLPPPGYDDMFM